MRLPKNITEEMQIDQENGINCSKDAIDKETKKSNIDYKPREDCTSEEV